MELRAKTRLARVLGSSSGRVAVQFIDNGMSARFISSLPVTGASMPPIGSLATCKLLEIGWVVVGWSDDERVVKEQVDRNLRSVFC